MQYHIVGDGRAAPITAIRIGFRPGTTTIVNVPGDSGVIANLSLDVLPALLGAVDVHDQALCPATSDGPAAFALWEQARNALLASIVARDVDAPTVRSVSYVRELDARGKHIDTQLVSDSIYVASRPVLAARSAEEFAAQGYRLTDTRTHGITFVGPDADVLLDPAFMSGHCLSLRDKPDASDVGIAFAPVADNDSIVDITGVLWLSRTVPALDSLTFHFTNLNSTATDAGAGGELLFTTMPTGVAMITRWKLHLPVISLPEIDVRSIGTIQRGAGRVTGFHDTGGELAEASWGDGTSWLGPLATIAGHVVTAGGVAPAAGTTVRLVGTRMEAQTDSLGAFVLPMTIPGPYVVEADDEIMAQLGVSSTRSVNVDLARSPVDIRLELPARAKPIGVFDHTTGKKIKRAAIRDTLGNQTVTTSTGVALLNDLAPVAGRYMLEIRKEGYAPQHVTLRADSSSELLVPLEPNALGSATALPAMITTDKRRMLEEDPGLREGVVARCQMTLVECVGRKDLDLEPPGQLVQLLKKTLGIYNVCKSPAPISIRNLSAATCGLRMHPSIPPPERYCAPTYFVNGVEWSPLAGTSQDELDQFLNSAVIEGIEVYLSGMPHPGRLIVNEQLHCGLVVIWTR